MKTQTHAVPARGVLPPAFQNPWVRMIIGTLLRSVGIVIVPILIQRLSLILPPGSVLLNVIAVGIALPGVGTWGGGPGLLRAYFHRARERVA